MALLSTSTKFAGRRQPPWLHLARCVALCAALAYAGAADLRGQAMEEYQVKAAFLFHFAHYVEWPSRVFKDSADPVALCTLGQNPFGRALDDMVSGQTLDGRRFVVRHFSDVQQVSGCHILFIGSSEKKRLRSILDRVKGSGLLTVGETDSFVSEGGVINFTLEDNKVHFEINVDAADQQQLKISSRLLSLARVARK